MNASAYAGKKAPMYRAVWYGADIATTTKVKPKVASESAKSAVSAFERPEPVDPAAAA